jgi:deoxyadenosine/deoxycytidine kinase
MMEELQSLPKKAPDLMIYLKADFETILKRMNKRGREFELNDELRDYYYTLWKDYDEWVEDYYDASEVLVIDTNELNLADNEEDIQKVLKMVEDKLKEVRGK